MSDAFKADVPLDAALLSASMRGGFSAFCAAAMATGISGGPDAAIKRAEWFKVQPESYIKEVIDFVLSKEPTP